MKSVKQKVRNLVAATAVIMLAGSSASAQERASARLEALQSQMNALQREIASLKSEVSRSKREIQRVNERAADIKATPRPDAPIVNMSSGNQPSICSADGRNCIGLTGRLHLDVGSYNYRPNTAATTPQSLIDGAIARRARIGVVGRFQNDWNYNLTFEAGGSGGATSPIIDVGYLAYTGFKPFTIWGGIVKAPYTLEQTMSSNNITFMERPTPQQIATGIGGAKRMAFGITSNGKQWWTGAFVTGPAYGTTSINTRQGAVTGRAVFLPVLTDRASLLIGGSAQYLFEPPGANVLNLRDRIEMRIDGTRVLSTGNIANVDNARVLSAELAGTYGSFHFQGEYFDFNIGRSVGRTLGFQGGYIQAGYILTGEKRNYSSTSGAYGGVSPRRPFDWKMGNWGAWEIAARYSMMDLNDEAGGILGGRQENVTIGLNWYVNRNIRFMLNYVNGKVDKRTATGGDVGAKYNAVAMRAQAAF